MAAAGRPLTACPHADISGALEDFVENSETRVLILPKQLKQGVDKTKVTFGLAQGAAQCSYTSN